MIVAYDMDGVLAAGPSDDIFLKKWRFMNGEERSQRKLLLLQWYSRAAKIFDPPEDYFYVITARKSDPEVQATTYAWLRRHFKGRVIAVHHLEESRSMENVLKFKTGVLRLIKAVEFTEDNVTVVRGIRKAMPEIHVWLFKDGIRIADPEKR